MRPLLRSGGSLTEKSRRSRNRCLKPVASERAACRALSKTTSPVNTALLPGLQLQAIAAKQGSQNPSVQLRALQAFPKIPALSREFLPDALLCAQLSTYAKHRAQPRWERAGLHRSQPFQGYRLDRAWPDAFRLTEGVRERKTVRMCRWIWHSDSGRRSCPLPRVRHNRCGFP